MLRTRSFMAGMSSTKKIEAITSIDSGMSVPLLRTIAMAMSHTAASVTEIRQSRFGSESFGPRSIAAAPVLFI